MLLSLILTPLLGIVIIMFISNSHYIYNNMTVVNVKSVVLFISLINILLSFIFFIFFDNSNNQFQFVQESYDLYSFDIYLGLDGLSIYFVLLTTILVFISIISNWKLDINCIILLLLLESMLLLVFMVLDIFMFYVFFEIILPPLFILMGIYGSSKKVRASFYFFLYTLFGSLFLLLSILSISSIMGTTDYDALYKTNFDYITQLFLFYGIFIAFAIKTPTIFLHNWLLKAHVESPLSGSILLAGIVLKLSLYGILRLILPILPKASISCTYFVYMIGVVTIIYASINTLKSIDVKELIAYSSVCHASVYLLSVFSNNIQGIEGGILLGIGHGFVSSGLFICVGGVLYDRSHTRVIEYFRGMAQIMPLFSVLFFILCLSNCGVPLTLNFVGEFLSLYGIFEKLPLLGIFASTSIVFSAAYTIFMFNRISFGGNLSVHIKNIYLMDLTKREFSIIFVLCFFTILFGVYPSPILDGLHYNVSSLIF